MPGDSELLDTPGQPAERSSTPSVTASPLNELATL